MVSMSLKKVRNITLIWIILSIVYLGGKCFFFFKVTII